jgi:hypothetical protein
MTNTLPTDPKDRAQFLTNEGRRVRETVQLLEKLEDLWRECGGEDNVFVDALGAFLSGRADEAERDYVDEREADSLNEAAAACMKAAQLLPDRNYHF